MKTLWQKILLIVLSAWGLAVGGTLAQAKGQPQDTSRVTVHAVAADDSGNLYVVGSGVNLTGQLPAGSLDLGGGMQDIWVAKLSAYGTPVFQALIGGKADDTAFSVAVRQGVVYILGETWSTDFPGAPGNAGENDAVVLALAADGSQVTWARRLGGRDQDSGRAIRLLGEDLYLTGITWSDDLVSGGWKGNADGFLARMDLSGGLTWLREFGGSQLDAPFGLAVGSGGVWVAGETFSPNLAGAPLGGGDAFALRFNANGEQQFAGLYGGDGEDAAYAAALAPDGSLVLAGDTQSAALPDASGQYGGDTDAFWMRLSASGDLQSSGYLGGSGLDSGMALAVLPDGSALIAGGSRSPVFPLGAAQSASSLGGQDAFLAQVSAQGTVEFVRLLGGSGEDDARGIAVTSSDVALVGSFSAGDSPYLQIVPQADLPAVTLPTAVTPLPTATRAKTATPRPTETPNLTPRVSELENTPEGEITPTQPVMERTSTGEASGTATPAGASVSANTPLPTALPTDAAAPQEGGWSTGVWAGGAILIVVIGASVYAVIRRKNRQNPPEG